MKGVMSFLSGAIMGGLVGATVALLFAPASGEDLRHQMQDRADHIQDEVRQAAATRRAELERELAAMRAPRR
jgi:gas vesicle protein